MNTTLKHAAHVLKSTTALCAFGAAAWAFTPTARAGCDTDSPVDGATVTCTAAAPNPQTINIGSQFVNDVTVIVQAGASIDGDLDNAIELGSRGTITTAPGSTVDGGISLFGPDGNVTIGGNVGLRLTAQGGGHTIVIEETGALSGIISNLMPLFGDQNSVTMNGTMTATQDRPFADAVTSINGDNNDFIMGATGSITSSGRNVSGILLLGDTNMVDVAGEILVSGNDSAAGIALNNGTGGTVMVRSGANVQASGDLGAAIAALGGTHSVTIQSGAVIGSTNASALVSDQELSDINNALFGGWGAVDDAAVGGRGRGHGERGALLGAYGGAGDVVEQGDLVRGDDARVELLEDVVGDVADFPVLRVDGRHRERHG
ncbi:MAG: hypothetical protein AAF337_05280, partial [Pseudomonadota bacterium]